jgi:hypothetical protein
MSWKTFLSGSGDRVGIPPNHSGLNNDSSRRNAFVFLVDLFPPARAGSGRSTVHGAGTEARSASGAKRLERLPDQSGSQCNLWIPQCRFRSRGVVSGRRSGHQPGTSGLQLQRLDLPTTDEPFAALILCTAGRQKVDKRTRSKWSRVLRYAAEYKSTSEPLERFIKRKGGINKCADRFTLTRCLGRYARGQH